MEWEETEPLRAPTAPRAPHEGRDFTLRVVLELMVRKRASDLHMKVGRPPVVRVDGELHEINLPPLRPEDLKRCAEQLLSVRQREILADRQEMDFAIGVQGLGRFRITAFQQRGTLGFAFRAIPVEIPNLVELSLPPVLQDIARYPRGLVLVTGVTGSGKSTTLAAMVRHLNEHRAVNVVTIEDPIEFLQRDVRAFISQREVGTDTPTFEDALRNVLRQDPDVIMLGEIRDAVAMETVLKAANTGHMVFSTLHTVDASQTIARIISFFPPHQHKEIRELLALTLRAVVSLRLIPRRDGLGRVPASEIMLNTATIADRIREGEMLHTIPDLIAEGRQQYGMQTFDQSLLELVRQNLITMDDAMQHATSPSEFALRASGIEAAGDMGWVTRDMQRMEG